MAVARHGQGDVARQIRLHHARRLQAQFNVGPGDRIWPQQRIYAAIADDPRLQGQRIGFGCHVEHDAALGSELVAVASSANAWPVLTSSDTNCRVPRAESHSAAGNVAFSDSAAAIAPIN